MTFALSRKAKFRLLKLAEYMRGLPKETYPHFSMENWFVHSGVHRHVPVDQVIKLEDITQCGTKACALGWATTCPYFRRLGLKMRAKQSGYGEVCWNDKSSSAHNVFEEIVQDLFDLDILAAQYFFRDIEARTPKEWASKVERKVA